VQGRYIARNATVIDAVRSVASGFIFTTSISPVICAGAIASIKYLKDHNELRERHQLQARKLRKKLQRHQIEVHPSACTHIVPVMIRDAVRCKELSDKLLNEHDIYVQPINWPTVEVGTERLRFAPTPLHTDAMISSLVDALRKVLDE